MYDAITHIIEAIINRCYEGVALNCAISQLRHSNDRFDISKILNIVRHRGNRNRHYFNEKVIPHLYYVITQSC